MTWTEAKTRQTAERRPGLGFAYVMTVIALGSIVISWVFGSIFSHDLVTTGGSADIGYTHQHVPIAAFTGWLWAAIAIWMVLPAAMQGIRANVTERAGWTVFGLGSSGIWLAVMFVSIFVPVSVTGTPPWLTWVPYGSLFAAIAGVILTGILCKFLKTTFFHPAVSPRQFESTPPILSSEDEVGDPATKLRQLAQVRDSGVIARSICGPFMVAESYAQYLELLPEALADAAHRQVLQARRGSLPHSTVVGYGPPDPGDPGCARVHVIERFGTLSR